MASMAKRRKKLQTFREEYHKKWPCITASLKGEHFARCSLCSCDFSVGHGGSNDVHVHVKSVKHRAGEDDREGNQDIATFFRPKDNGTIRAEVLMVQFLTEHNIAVSAADHLSSLVKTMFPDSQIASKFACHRTKATAIARTLGQDAKVK